MMEPGDIDIQAYEINLKKWGICPYMSMGMSQVPCTDKCALYIHTRGEVAVRKGCTHKAIAMDLFRIAELITDDPTH